MSEDHNISLSSSQLSAGYTSGKENTIIVQNVNLRLKRGSFTTMVGINGSGKSTLLRTLAGLQKPISGGVLLQNSLLNTIGIEKKAKKLSVVLTGQYISKNLTVLELVALGRQPYTNWLGKLSQEDKDQILNALSATELEDLKNTACHALSDGQFQRALIARALAQNTEVILLDEPTTHLDLHHKAAIFSLLKTIAHEQQKTILCTSHDIELVLEMSDEMIVIHDRNAIQNTPKNLIDSGVFEHLFPDNIIGFSKETHRFFIR